MEAIEKIKYVCENCGALHDWNDIKYVVAKKNGFTPIKVQEKPREEVKIEPRPEPPKPVSKPQIKKAEYIDDDDEEVEDLRID